jgi:hypothetical protein
VDDQHAGGSLSRALLEFVGPTAVVGHGIAVEHLGIQFRGVGRVGDLWIVDEHDDRLALDIHVLEVVPVEFRRFHAVAGKDQIRILDCGAIGYVFCPGDDFVRPLEGLFTRSSRDRQRLTIRSGNSDERHLLDVGAVGVAWLQAEFLELVFQIPDGQVLTLRSWSPPFVLVRGEDLDAVEDRLRFDARGGSRRRTCCLLCWRRGGRVLRACRDGEYQRQSK